MKTPMNEPITMFKKLFNFLSIAVPPSKYRFIYLHNQSKSSYNYYNDKLHNEGFLLNLYSIPDRPIF